MTQKLFTVVQMPSDNDMRYNPIAEAEYFPTFEQAFDRLIENTGSNKAMPKREQPLSIEHSGMLHEIWIINRAENHWYAG